MYHPSYYRTTFHWSAGLLSIFTLVALLILAFEIWMFVDVIQNKKLSTEAKVLWVVGMFLVHPIVAVIYFFVGRSKKAR